MIKGMLWIDASKDPFALRLERAVEYHKKKYGSTPDLCFVNPAEFDEKSIIVNGVNIQPLPLILPHHLWLGFVVKL